MRLVADGVRMSLHALDQDPGQLAGQLFGRLGDIPGSELPAILIEALAEAQGSFVLPRRASLVHPGPLRQTFHAHDGGVEALAITSGGKQATSSSYHGPVKVWNLEDGRLLEESFSAAPDLLRERTLTMSDLEPKVRDILQSHGDEVTAVAITPDGKRAISGDSYGTLKIWDLDRVSLSYRAEKHGDLAHAVAVTPDGKRAITTSRDRTLKVWDVEAGCVEATLSDQDSVTTSVAITPDGERAICGSTNGMLKVWNLTAGVLESTLEGHGAEVSAVAITPDGRRAVSACGQEVKAWDIASGECTRSPNQHLVGAVAITSDGTRAYLGTYNDIGDPARVRVWDLATNQLVGEVSGGLWHISAVSVSPNGKWASLRSDGRMGDGDLAVCNLQTGCLIATVDDGADEVRAIAEAPDGDYAISGSRTGRLKIWQLPTGHSLASFNVDASVTAVAVARDGVLVAGDSSGAVHILQCLSAVSKPEACRLLDVVERRLRQQISTFRGHSIAARRAGAVARIPRSLSTELFFTIGFNISDNSSAIGIVVFTGRTILDGSDKIVINDVEFKINDPQETAFGSPSEVKYALVTGDRFIIHLYGWNEKLVDCDDLRIEELVRRYQIRLDEPINWPSGGSRIGLDLHGTVTSKDKWRCFLQELEQSWMQANVCTRPKRMGLVTPWRLPELNNQSSVCRVRELRQVGWQLGPVSIRHQHLSRNTRGRACAARSFGQSSYQPRTAP